MSSTTAKPRGRWRRRLFKIAIIFVVALVGLALTAPMIVGWIIGHQLRGQLAGQLGAQLDYARVVYQYPYGVRIEKAHLLMPGTNGAADSWVDVGRLELTLAKLPIGAGPVLIQKLEIDNPTVHLSRSTGSAKPKPPAAPPSAAAQKLSELFGVQDATLSNGRFEDDLGDPGHPPLICDHISVKMNVLHGGLYQFAVAIEDQPAAAHASGSFDIDSLQLNADEIDLAVNCDLTKPNLQLPASAAEFKIGGKLTFNAIARIPLLTPIQGWYAARLVLNDGRCQPPGWTGPVAPAKFSLLASNLPGATADSLPTALPQEIPGQPGQSHLWVNGLSVACGNQIFRIDGGELLFNPADNAWTVRKFHGITDIGDGPGPLAGANTRIFIPFIAAGDGKPADPNSSLRIALDDGSASITPNHIHINRINGMLTVTAAGLRSSTLTANCADGQVKAIVNLDWKPPKQTPPISLSYGGDAEVKQLNLHQLAMQYTADPAVRQQAFGTLDLAVKYHGSILQHSPATGANSPADRLTARGDLDITHGYFLDIPILRDLLIAMHNPSGSTVGEAAATFAVAHSVVNFDHTGASSPVLGIQGGGTLGFDKKVDMNFVATPLADWAKDIKSTGLIGGAGAAIVGKAQDVVNGLQSAIYQFRLTGDVSKPKVEPVVAPFLTDKMAPLFKKMAGNQKQGSIAEELKKERGDR